MGAAELIEAADALMAQGDYPAVIAKCREALDDPAIEFDQKKDAWDHIAAAHVRSGQFEDADEAARQGSEAFQATYASLKADWQTLFKGGAGDLMADVLESVSRGDWAAVVLSAEATLSAPGLDDDFRDDLYTHLAIAYLWLGDWGRAEEYAQFMKPSRRQEYDSLRWERMTFADKPVDPSDLPHYDGSAFDDVVADGKAKFEAKDYRWALEAFRSVVTETSGRGPFGVEVRLYVALCYLYLGEDVSADYYSADLTGAWLDSYNEHRAALGGGR